jgi:hypothetical protein
VILLIFPPRQHNSQEAIAAVVSAPFPDFRRYIHGFAIDIFRARVWRIKKNACQSVFCRNALASDALPVSARNADAA